VRHSFLLGGAGSEDAAVKGGFDRGRSLQELEQDHWGEPNYDSYLVATVHRLRRKALAEFTVEDFRIMIGQGIGLPFLIPLAVERLEEEPLAAGDLYPGDLLAAVLRTDRSFWLSRPEWFQRIRKIIEGARDSVPALNEMDRQTVREILEEASNSLDL
jgi:hypothetical protein